MKVLVDNSKILNIIDRTQFLGFTLDADQFEGDYYSSCLEELNNPVVKNLCKELKPATIRLGGNGIDRFYFLDDDPEGTAVVPGKYDATIDKRKCHALGEFCREIGAGLMLSLPMLHGDVENAGRLADYFINKRKDHVPFLEMSNEPDWGWKERVGEYPEKVKIFHRKLASRFPYQRWMAGYGGRSFPFGICEPDSSPVLDFVEQCHKLVDVFTVHFYVGNRKDKFAGTKLLLGPYSANVGHNRIYEMRSILDLYSIDKPIAVNEFNTYAGQGLEGTSNTMSAALWIADVIGNLAREKALANNIQCGFAKRHGKQLFHRYALIDTNHGQVKVNPHYYSMYMWNRMMGKVILPTCGNSHPVSIHATKEERNDNTIQLMLINKDIDKKQKIEIEFRDFSCSGRYDIFTLEAVDPEGRDAAINSCVAGDDGLMPEIKPVKKSLNRNEGLQFVLSPGSVSVINLHNIPNI